MLALAAGSLLASTSQAHSPTTTPYPAPEPATVVIPLHVEVAAFTGPVVSCHPTVSTHPSFGGFHSAPAYHGFSASPSRTFTFSSRPAATVSRTATVTRSFVGTSPARSAPTRVVNHYYGNSTGGGMSVGEAILLHQALSQGSSAPPVTLTSYGLQQDTGQDAGQVAVAAPEPPGHFWRNTGLVLLAAGVGYGLFRFWRSQTFII